MSKSKKPAARTARPAPRVTQPAARIVASAAAKTVAKPAAATVSKSSAAPAAKPARPADEPTPAQLDRLFGTHFTDRIRKVEAALAASGFDALLVTSGTPHTYFADDQDAPHKVTPHFAHWTPLAGPHHLLRLQSGRKPLLVRVAPEDYWYEQAPLGKPFWAHRFDLKEVGDVEKAYALCRT
ncbi:MAG: hypothetical protein EPO68_10315, partial [Planctomycetota bacterium]